MRLLLLKMTNEVIPLDINTIKLLTGNRIILREFRRNRKTKVVSQYLHNVLIDNVSNIYGSKLKLISVTLLDDSNYIHKLFEFDPDKEEAKGVGDSMNSRYIFTKL